MEKKDNDIFEATNKNPFEKDKNFFLKEEISYLSNPAPGSIRRLNDYDFNLLKEDAYKDISDDLFKLEYKLSKTEDEIKSLEAQIQAAQDINDNELVGTLMGRKRILEEDYETLSSIYNTKSLSAKITTGFSDKIKASIESLKAGTETFTENIVSKLPPKLASVFELRKSLNKLENLNKSVDELMSMNIPYGENIDKYEQLSKYIIKANSIQNEISKFIK